MKSNKPIPGHVCCDDHGEGPSVYDLPVPKALRDEWQRLATVRALLAYMWAHPGKQLLFMGCELADDREWSEARGLDWGLLDDPARAGVGRLLHDLNRVYRQDPALYSRDTDPSGFRWITAQDAGHNTLAFLRSGTGEFIL